MDRILHVMKPHLHKILNLFEGDVVAVHADAPSFVFFADTDNYDAYLNDYDYDYFGSAVKEWPFYIAPPNPGKWHLIVEQSDTAKDLDVRIEIIEEQSLR